MQERRGREALLDLARGPARLCEALAIVKGHDGTDLTDGGGMYVERPDKRVVRRKQIVRSPRIGLSQGKDLELRYFLEGSRFVSGKRTNGRPLRG